MGIGEVMGLGGSGAAAESGAGIQGVVAGSINVAMMIGVGILVIAFFGFIFYIMNNKIEFEVWRPRFGFATKTMRKHSEDLLAQWEKSGLQGEMVHEFIIKRHKGRELTSGGVTVFKLLFGKEIPYPDNLRHTTFMVGKKIHYKLIQVGPGRFKFLTLDTAKLVYKAEDQETLDWHLNKQMALTAKYSKQSFLEKYGTYIALAFTLIICFLIFLLLFKNIDGLLDRVAQLIHVASDVGTDIPQS